MVASASPVSRLDSKYNELRALKKVTLASSYANTPAPSHASVLASAESTLALKYKKTDLMKILKIFLKAKGHEPQAQVSCERPLKAKVPDVYFGNLHMDFYHFC